MESKALAIMPTGEEWSQMKDIAMMAVKSGLLPKAVDTPEKAVIIALKGRELGLPPMVSFSHINVIQGKPTMSAEIMLAYIYKDHPTADIKIVERSETRCEIHARRPHEESYSKFIWDLDRAKKMQLIGKDNWVKQPGTMMFWRAITEMKRAKFPEVLMGIDYSTEELEESLPKDVTPKTVTPTITEPENKLEPKSAKTLKNHAPQSKEEAEKKAAESKKKQQEEAAAAATESQEQAPPEDKPAAKTRGELVKDLLGFQSALGISNADFTVEIKNLTGKTTKELSNQEIADLCVVFEGRLYKEMGEDANV